MKFTAAGDMIIQKRIYPTYEGFQELGDFIKQGDARFFNLETTLHHTGEAYGGQFSGGTYIRTDPEVLEDVKAFGFNMTSFNNNHVLDFSYPGLMCTLEAVNKSGLIHAGVGRNLAEAAAPRYLETQNGRVALISLNSTFEPSCMAGEQSPLFPGRPGINGLRLKKYVTLPKEKLAFIKALAEESGINVAKEITRKEGYYPALKESEAEFGELKFFEGEETKYVMEIEKEDLCRVEKAIYEAQLQADYIMISVHSHELSGTAKENPSAFLVDFAHFCIDAGAHAVVGHGPHLLRPIEVYRNCPIFYSLGDFVLQLYNVETAPEDFFRKHGLSSESTVHDLLKKRSKNFTVGLMEDKRMFRSVIPYWETADGRLTKLSLMPIEMKMDGHRSETGLPRRSKNPEIGMYLAEMCKPYGTCITEDQDGMLKVNW